MALARHSKTGIRGLYRDADGRYRIDLRWRDPSTGQWKRHCEKLPLATTSAAAKLRARDILAAALSGQFEPNREKPRRLGDSLDEYLEWARINRPKTYKDRTVLAKSLKTILGDPLIEELSPFHLERFKKVRSESGLASATINRAVAMLKHFYGLAASWGWVNGEHARTIRGVRLLREPPGRIRYLHDDEEHRLFNVLPTGIRPIVITALLSGMRLGEIVLLRRDAVDLGSRMITLQRTKSNRVRRVPINDALAMVLRESITTSGNDFIFVNSKGNPYTVYGVSGMFRKATQKANIPNLRFHDLRHDFATKLRKKGVGIDAIAALLGHTSLAVTQRYAHIGAETLREAVCKLDVSRKPSKKIERSILKIA